MSSDWNTDTLANYCTKIGSGATPRGGKETYFDRGISLIRSQNVYNTGFSEDGLAFINETQANELRNVEVQSDDVLLNITGESVGRCCQVPDRILPARVNQHVVIIRTDKNRLDPGFLRYYLVTPLAQSKLEGLSSSGATRRALTKGMIESLEIPIPPIEEQRKIAAILGSIDDKIELNRRMNATLESMTQAIFKSWFIDFDPVHRNAARRVGQASNRSNIPEQSTNFDHLFPDSFEESELGIVPKGWRIGLLSDIAEITMGTSPKSSTYNDVGNGLPLINGPVEFGEYFPLKVKWTTAPTKNSMSGDLIFCVRGSTTGRSVVSDGTYGLGRGVCSIRSRNSAQEFVNRVVFSQLERMLSGVTGSVFPSLSTSQINDFKILQPTIEVIRCFTALTSPLSNVLESNVRENLQLSSIRDNLLSRLLLTETKQTNGAASLEARVL